MLVQGADLETLLLEIASRYKALVILGIHKDDDSMFTQVLVGPAYATLGLMDEAMTEIRGQLLEYEH